MAEHNFYIVEDLRLNNEKRFFPNRQEALAAYRQLPQTGVKALGCGETELVRCVPIFPSDREGEDVLVVDKLAENTALHGAAQRCVDTLHIRYCLDGTRLLPAPEHAARKIKSVRLWAGTDCIRWVYMAGTGWLSRDEFERRYPKEEDQFCYPLVLKYQIEAKTRDGQFVPMEVSPWDYKRLKYRMEHQKQAPHPARRAEDKL